MEIEGRVHGASWRWTLLLSVIFLNICLPNLVLSYGVVLVHSLELEAPAWLGLVTPALFLFTYSCAQCWCRDAADSWGTSLGYRAMAAMGLILIVIGLILSAFLPIYLHPYVYGVLGGLGSSLISAQVDAVIFDSYDTRLGFVRGFCLTGQAVGQALFPHIITALIDYYGFTWSFLVLGGIMLQTMIAIMFLKVDESIRKPYSMSRYGDYAQTYAMFNNDMTNSYYVNDVQLHEIGKKCWQSPSDDNLHREEDYFDDDDDSIIPTITPPPSPEEKRRNIFGVEILPEIPEESESSDIDEPNTSKDKRKFSVAIKRLSTLGDNLDEYIMRQTRRDSQISQSDTEGKDYIEVEVMYDNISPVTDIQREKVFNSLSFRCQSAFASFKRRMCMPSYRAYRLKRRFVFFMYNINDTFIKPLTASLTCWRFYPALMLSFARLSMTAVMLVLLPLIASKVKPKISNSESNFLMSLHGFAWICFLLSTPWLVQTSRGNLKYVTVFGLGVSTTACFVLAAAPNHDSYSVGCVVAGLGYGAIASCWEPAIQDLVGARKWPKIHSTLETISATLLVSYVVGIIFLVDEEDGLQYSMFILGIIMAVVTGVWFIICLVSLYLTKLRSLRLVKR